MKKLTKCIAVKRDCFEGDRKYQCCCVACLDVYVGLDKISTIFSFCCSVRAHTFVCFWHDSPQWARASALTRFLDHTQQCTTVGRTPLDEWSARCRDLYMTTHNTHNRQTPMPTVGFKPTTPADEQPQTYALDYVATGTSSCSCSECKFIRYCS